MAIDLIVGGAQLLSGIGQGKHQEQLSKAQAARERKAAVIDRRARALGGELSQISTARGRRALITQSRQARAAATQATAGGLRGSSIAAAAGATITQQTQGELSFSLLSEDFGKRISDLSQESADVRAGVGESDPEAPGFVEGIFEGFKEVSPAAQVLDAVGGTTPAGAVLGAVGGTTPAGHVFDAVGDFFGF